MNMVKTCRQSRLYRIRCHQGDQMQVDREQCVTEDLSAVLLWYG